jgi:hypothetical protein
VVLWRHLSNPISSLKRALTAYHRIDPSAHCPTSAARPTHRTIHRLTATEVDEAMADYRAGATIRELGSRFGVDRHAVARALKARGVQLRRTRMTTAEVQEAAKLYAQDLSLVQSLTVSVTTRPPLTCGSEWLKCRCATLTVENGSFLESSRSPAVSDIPDGVASTWSERDHRGPRATTIRSTYATSRRRESLKPGLRSQPTPQAFHDAEHGE